jgi:hypothetical protein
MTRPLGRFMLCVPFFATMSSVKASKTSSSPCSKRSKTSRSRLIAVDKGGHKDGDEGVSDEDEGEEEVETDSSAPSSASPQSKRYCTCIHLTRLHSASGNIMDGAGISLLLSPSLFNMSRSVFSATASAFFDLTGRFAELNLTNGDKRNDAIIFKTNRAYAIRSRQKGVEELCAEGGVDDGLPPAPPPATTPPLSPCDIDNDEDEDEHDEDEDEVRLNRGSASWRSLLALLDLPSISCEDDVIDGTTCAAFRVDGIVVR